MPFVIAAPTMSSILSTLSETTPDVTPKSAAVKLAVPSCDVDACATVIVAMPISSVL